MIQITSLLLVALVTGSLGQTYRYPTVIDALKANRETTLLSLIDDAGLTATLQGPGPFTIFAPTNTAFYYLGSATLNNLRHNTSVLAEVLKYHVVSGKMTLTDLQVNEKQLTALSGDNIRVNFYNYNHNVAVEGSTVTRPNIVAGNGVVHVVNRVMTPAEGSIMDILAASPHFSTLAAAIQVAGLGDDLNEGLYTLMAPNNKAFSLVGNDTLSTLLAHPDTLRTILLYHVLHGTLYTTGMHSGSFPTLDTADAEHITAHISSNQNTNTVTVDGSRSFQTDISATNGVIHEVTDVLVPKSMLAVITNLIATTASP